MKLFYTLLLVVGVSCCFAQKQGNQWYFGKYAALNFNSGAPVPVLTNVQYSNEGCASIADNNGNLLFYTDGVNCYDRTNTQMPHGAGLGGNTSTTQSSLIVPVPGSSTQYYIFTADCQGGYYGTGDSGVNYNIVDMTLNGGLGDVSTLDRLLVTPTTEKLCASFAANGTDIWVVTHLWNSNSFYAYKITSGGISSPVISSVGIVHEDVGSGYNAEAIGYMKISPDGSMLALACNNDLNTVQLFNFSDTTGAVTGPVMTDTSFLQPANGVGPYGVSFSPDNSKLYIGYLGFVNIDSKVFQYNLLAGDSTAILASRVTVYSDPGFGIGALQNGPDGKMYVDKLNFITFVGSDSIDVINDPNALGGACDYVSDGLYLGDSGVNAGLLGLPNMIEQYLIPCSPATINIVPHNPSICFGTTVTLSASGATAYTWSPATGLSASTGDTVVAGPSVTTTYTVTSSYKNCASSDTDVVSVSPLPNKPTISQNGFVLTSSATQGNQWLLNDSIIPGATNETYTFTTFGWYQVIAENPANGCSSTSDSLDITSGINQLTAESGQVTVYPNPTGGEINVSISSSAMDVRDWNLQVTDVLGRILLTKSSLNYNNEIDLPSADGVYFISVITKANRMVIPVVKQ